MDKNLSGSSEAWEKLEDEKTCLIELKPNSTPLASLKYARLYDLLFMFVIWSLWMTIGTIYFRAYYGWGKSFYMATNVGYSIGWSYPEVEQKTLVFACVYLAVGALLVFAAIAYFVDWILDQNASQYRDIRDLGPVSNGVTICLEFEKHRDVYIYVGMFVVWVVFGMIWSHYAIKWSWIESLFFSLSTLSAGGLYTIPSSASEMDYALVGLFACTGIPIMALALGTIVRRLIEYMSRAKITEALRENIIEDDFQMMFSECVNPSTGILDEHKLLVYILAKQRAVSLDLVHAVYDKIRSRVNGSDVSPVRFSAMGLVAARSGSMSSITSNSTAKNGVLRVSDVFSSYDSRDSDGSSHNMHRASSPLIESWPDMASGSSVSRSKQIGGQPSSDGNPLLTSMRFGVDDRSDSGVDEAVL